jgi:hypothetical protein
MTITADLLGYINSSGGPAGFVLPVFHDGTGTYIQQGDEAGRLKAFMPVDVYEDEMIPPQGVVTARVGQHLLYAFRFPNGRIWAAERERVQEYLAKNHALLKDVPFARLDALVFAGALDDAREAVASARNRAAIKNVSLADFWAASEQRYLQEKTANLAEPLGAKPVLLVFSEGFISWPELKRQLAWAAERNFEVRLRLRLVRACHTRRAAELVRTFGLSPTRLDGESAFIRVNAGSYRRLQEIGHLVMVVEATLKLDQVVQVTALDTNRLRKRYFKRDERKRLRSESAPDYRYEATA